MTQFDWARVLIACGVKPATAAMWAEPFAAAVRPEAFSVGMADVRDFLGQALHETAMLERLVENLNYSAERLVVVWPRRFPTLHDALPYARSPERLAGKVYGGRLGNIEPGDGWLYRGRGIPQVTGRDNYALVQRVTGMPVLVNPDMLAQPMDALRAGVAWWEKRVPDAVLGDVERVTLAVNGGTVGLDDRERLTALAAKALA